MGSNLGVGRYVVGSIDLATDRSIFSEGPSLDSSISDSVELLCAEEVSERGTRVSAREVLGRGNVQVSRRGCVG